VPGNGADTVLASPLPQASGPTVPGVAAYRAKAAPDLPPLRERRTPGGAAAPLPPTAGSWRVSFEKKGDARYISHRNTMDVFERSFRAANLPVRYTEGYNPHMRLSMGPALPLGQESAHELFDVDTLEALHEEHLAGVNARLPEGLRVTGWSELPKGAKSLGKSAVAARYRFTLPNGEVLVETLSLSGKEATTPKRFLESRFGVPPEAQHAIRVVREETLLSVR
jgi:radical SAM-linked protein